MLGFQSEITPKSETNDPVIQQNKKALQGELSRTMKEDFR